MCSSPINDVSAPVIIALCGDPGGANALAPVILALQGNTRYRVRTLAYRQGTVILSRHGLPFEELEENIAVEDAVFLLRRGDARMVLLGSSYNGVDLEKKFIKAAQLLSLPSLTLLDFWSNYIPRFSNQAGELVYVPDKIAVMDNQAREEMIVAGFDAERIVVTGQPAFDRLAIYRRRASHDWRRRFRQRLGIKPGERLVLFASQPLAAFFGENPVSSLNYGYNEKKVIAILIKALESIAQAHRQKITLYIRPHPRENIADLGVWRSEIIRLIISDQDDGYEVALASDLVTGMTTMLLVEACLLGCVVVSLQPGLRLSDILPTNRQGFSRGVYHEAEVEPVIRDFLFDGVKIAEMQARLKGLKVVPHATRQVVQVIDTMLP